MTCQVHIDHTLLDDKSHIRPRPVLLACWQVGIKTFPRKPVIGALLVVGFVHFIFKYTYERCQEQLGYLLYTIAKGHKIR